MAKTQLNIDKEQGLFLYIDFLPLTLYTFLYYFGIKLQYENYMKKTSLN